MTFCDDVPVCNIRGSVYYGSELEAKAVRLTHGQRILVNGKEETVDFVWFYEHPIIDLVGGGSVIPAFGQTFEILL